MFYGIRYTKALQEILNTEGGKLARSLVQLSTPAFAGKIETYTQRQEKWSDSGLSPQDAAIASIAQFGMDCAYDGETPEERLAGSTLQLALMDYAKHNPSAEATCRECLGVWIEEHQSRRPTTEPDQTKPVSAIVSLPDRFHVLLLKGDAAASATILRWILMLPEGDLEQTSPIVDEEGNVGGIVSSYDSSSLRDRCLKLGFKVHTISIPRQRPHENSHLVEMDLRLTGQYEEWRRKWLGAGQ